MSLRIVLILVLVSVSAGKDLWKDANLQLSEIKKGDRSFGESNMKTVKNPAGRGKVLRLFYPKKSYKPSSKPLGGAGFFKRLSKKQTTVTLTYDLYFAKNFNFVKGGKLPGLYGGSKKCSGGKSTSKCFSTRFMFREKGKGEIYLYAPKNQHKNFCKDKKKVKCNFKYGHSLGRGSWKFVKGRWNTISQRVRLNDVGKKNGYIKVWLNRKQVLNFKNVNFRNSKKIMIEGMFFSTFFGGSSKSWATPVNTYTYYRNFKMTT